MPCFTKYLLTELLGVQVILAIRLSYSVGGKFYHAITST